MLKPFLILSAILLQAQAPPPAAEFKIPADASAQVNPVKASAEGLAHSKKIYGYECAVCHGDDGSGAGDLAKNMKAKMPDFRDPTSLKSLSDGDLFYIIKNGKGEMESEGARLKTDDTWSLVNYVRSFAKLQAAAQK
jgi:mono/diheme cytochrome c family protein